MESISSLLLKRITDEEIELKVRLEMIEKRAQHKRDMNRIRNQKYRQNILDMKMADPDWNKPKIGRPKKVKSQAEVLKCDASYT